MNYSYLTTYRKHYVPKPIKLFRPPPPQQEYPDPVAAPQKPYLFLKKKNLKPPEEDGEEYFETCRSKFKNEPIFQKPLDSELLVKNFLSKEEKSEYQVEFCDLGRELKEEEEFRLPDDAVIQLTTQRMSYKNPLDLTPRALDPPRVIVPSSTLGEDDRIAELLHVKTGVSEYNGPIGELGEFILEANLEKKCKE